MYDLLKSKVTFSQAKRSHCLNSSNGFGAGSLYVVSSTIIQMVSRVSHHVSLPAGPDQTSSKRSPPFLILIGARKLLCFSAQSEFRTAATVWNLSSKTLSPGTLLAVLYFSSCHIFPPV